MKVFLQNNMVDHLVLPVLEWAKSRGHEIIDQSCVIDTDLDKHHDWEEPTIIVGSVGLMKQCKAHPKASKWIHYDQVNFDANKWKKIHGTNFLNHDGVDIAVWEVPALLEKHEMHLRPSCDDKMFIGGVYNVEKWHKTVEERQIDMEGRVYASTIKIIDAEVRYWVYQSHAIASSMYRLNGKSHREHITDTKYSPYMGVLKNIISVFSPAEMFVIDIAFVDNKPYLLEYNPIHGAGWYDAPTQEVMDYWESMYSDNRYFDKEHYMWYEVDNLKYGKVTKDNIELYCSDPDTTYGQTFTFNAWWRFKNGMRHSYSSPATQLSDAKIWYLNGAKINEEEYKLWLIEMGMDINNLTKEDKILIDLKWDGNE